MAEFVVCQVEPCEWPYAPSSPKTCAVLMGGRCPGCRHDGTRLVPVADVEPVQFYDDLWQEVREGETVRPPEPINPHLG